MVYPAPGVPVDDPPPGWRQVELTAGVAPVVAWETVSVDGVDESAGARATSSSGGTSRSTGVDATGSKRSRSEAALVFFHGNGENLETLHRMGFLDELEARAREVLVLEYPGYGRSGGVAGEESLAAAGRAALEHARRRNPERPLVVMGWSLGAAVAVDSAARVEVDGLALYSPWSSLPAVARTHFPDLLVRWLVRERWDSLASAARITAPAVVVHGGRDRLIPPEHGRSVAAALSGPVEHRTVARAGHNDLFADPQAWSMLEALLERVEREREGERGGEREEEREAGRTGDPEPGRE